MDYHVNSRGKDLGRFSLEELRRRHATGEISGGDLVWREGMSQWITVDALLREGPARPQNCDLPGEGSRSKPRSHRVIVWVLAVSGVLAVLFLAVLGVVAWKFAQKARELRDIAATGGTSGLAAASKPIRITETARTREVVRKRAREFRVRQYVEAYRKHGQHDVSWDQDAAQLIEAWIAVSYGSPTNVASPVDLARKIVAIPDCNDPLMFTAAGAVAPDPKERINRLDRALAAYEGSSYPAYPKFFAAVQLANELGTKAPRTPELHVTAIEQFRQCFEDGSFIPDDEEEIADILVDGWGRRFFDRNASAVIEIVRKHEEYKWLALTLEGVMEIDEAWKARGGGWAHTVTPEGWRGFEAHLSKARAALTEAWELYPNRPLAPACMITVAMGDGDANEMRVWFDRAIAGQIDLQRAWNSMRTGLLPRWHGSHAAILALGVRALDTGRFDTDVPRQLFDCITTIEGDLQLPPGEHIYGREDVWPHLKRMYEGYLAEPSNAGSLRGWHSTYAVVAYLAGKYDVARNQLEAVDWKPVRRSLTQWGRDLSLLPLKVAAVTGDQANEIIAAEADYEQGNLSRALKRYKNLSSMPQTDSRTGRFIRARLAAIEQEIALAKGEWIDFLPNGENDPNWEFFDQPIRKLNDGGVEIESGPTGHAIYSRTRIGCNFEVTGEIEFVRSSTGAFQAGLMMGIPDDARPRWYAFRIKSNEVEGKVASFSRGWTSQEFAIATELNKNRNTFRFRLRQRHVEAWINDVLTLRVAEPEEQFLLDDHSMLGLGAFNDSNETVVRYRNIKVRRIKPTD